MEPARVSRVSIPMAQAFTHQDQETDMNWDRIEGNWKEYKGKAKQQWGKLTDDDLDVIEGRRDELEGMLQQRYGYAKDQAQAEIDKWARMP
jgi:uncharacterized protein YjbJ (UPF0337 family)